MTPFPILILVMAVFMFALRIDHFDITNLAWWSGTWTGLLWGIGMGWMLFTDPKPVDTEASE